MSDPGRQAGTVMKTDLSAIAFVLDRSGSMDAMLEAAIAGFNHFLREQQAAPGEARLTLVLFDDQYEVPCRNLPIAEVTELDTSSYVPRGSTALLDAVGRTIDELEAGLAAMPESARPAKVIVAILTDGQENSSRRYCWTEIQNRIARQRDQHGWDFLFLGANQDAIATAAQLGIGAHMAAAFCSDAAGKMAADRAISRKTSSIRAAQLRPLSGAEADDLAAPLERLVREEDRKQRGQ